MELWDLYDSERKPLNKTHERGQPFAEGEFYVCAEIWVKNSEGKFLITKRHPDKKAGNLWEFSGGGTLAGETTKQSAVRELEEETVDAKWSSPAEIQQMIDNGEFVYSVSLRFELYKDIVC